MIAQLVEKLEGTGKLKATMLKARPAWADGKMDDLLTRLEGSLDEVSLGLFKAAKLSTDWTSFGSAMRIDRAIAELAGGPLDDVLRQMERHSASINLGGVYKIFVKEEPHRSLPE